MCGIAGIIHSDRGQCPDPRALARMNDALRHRGPDDAHTWEGGPAGIAARRLSIRDIDHGRQPMANEDASLVVALNGEIYNDAELRRELEAKGFTFRTTCDTETLLRAVEAWGDDAVHRLNGMFAFAAWDARRDRLLLVRDRIGIKPLFYTETGGCLAFASELDALMQSGISEGEIDPSALDAYLTYLYVPAPDTIYEGVKKLRPGELLTYEQGRLSLRSWWQPQYRPDAAWTLDSGAERLRELVDDSVRLRRVADVPLGAFLSGGVDSSAIVSTLAGSSDEKLRTFSIGFDDNDANELPYARAVADRHGTQHTEAMARPDLVELAPRMARHFGEPFADSSAIPTWLVSELARRDVTVALSGDGGDELFAGYTWLQMNRRVAQLRALPASLRRALRASLPGSPKGAKLTRAVDDTFLTHHESFRRRSTCFTLSERMAIYAPELRSRVLSKESDRFQEHVDDAAGWPDDDWMLRQDLRMYLPDDVLTKVDRTSMAHGLEVRVPLLDHRIVEFAFTLPFDLKLRRGISKRVLKHAYCDKIPAACLQQRKRGFAVPIDRWFRELLGEHFRETVLARDSRVRQWLDADAIAGMLDAHESGRAGGGHRLWALLMLEQWLQYDSARGSLDLGEVKRASA